MKQHLVIEFFDSKDYDYKHMLVIPLAENPNLTIHDGVLHVANKNGTTHHVPLANVKQYYKSDSAS